MKNSDPDLTQLQSPLSLNIRVEGQSYLYFSGTAYLGIPQNPDFMALYQEGLKKFGLNNGTSRGNNVQLGIYNEAEHYAAQYFGAEEALITSSGYLAAQLLVRHYTAYGKVLYAPQTHPALWLNEAPAVGGTFSSWAENALTHINTSKQNKWLLVSNALNNLFPERYDFSFLKEIHPDNEVILIVDDSHGIGVLDDGRGVLNLIAAPKHVKVVVVASMAKALGVDAGIILGTRALVAGLKKSNVFMGASPPAAAGLYAFMHAKALYRAELNRLKQHMETFSAGISPEEWDFIPDYPVYLSKDRNLYTKLLQHHILISSFPYPDQNGPSLNRVVLSSWASPESINELLEAIAAQKEYP
ncbi:aminotransferase class I/II-fold pyridoxal phosphate-dependent enzyme [Pedobacter heparinus]|uniref:Aminotransferase class I and II n=1 Tax=Pedobacter heparinus (strain ATCC 13125 / DSM 2366 / CIP 104194 / JCM 7457 / NBRC 12017 / NCIMB 9290 / NRRL B-14731 / HIM 762-3) TaxID=485917 RepID=C6XXH1_PEDHD|nr:aminotransferase class I/II-fold pyridoxal phosphate-dependent enzyme [Pedobacter heparinus]ACU06477.1 aminotransferase class I and II [Pedobacter heparinus DSM 2366]